MADKSAKQISRPDHDLLEFHPDAVEVEYRQVAGGARWTLYTIFFLVISLITWASLSDIDRIVTTHGKIITTSPPIVVQSLTTSTILTINAKVGQVVKKGQILATLDPTFSESDVIRLRETLQGLQSLVNRLQAELDTKQLAKPSKNSSIAAILEYQIFTGRKAQHTSKLRSFDAEMARLKAKFNTIRQNYKGYSDHVKVLYDVEAMFNTLAKSRQGSRLDLLHAKEKRIGFETKLLGLDKESEEIQYAIAAVEANKQVFIAQWQLEVSLLMAKKRIELISTAQQLHKSERLNALVNLTSPVDAVVLEIAKRSIGSVIKEAEPLFTLVALDVPLEAEVEVQTKDIGRIRNNDAVRIKLEAFPFQKHGTLQGRIRIISSDALTSDIVKGATVVFMSRILLLETNLKNVPPDFKLLPGMKVTGEIHVGTRRIISYFLYPIIRAFDESIREP